VVVSLPITRRALVVGLLVLGFSAAPPVAQALAQADVLPSWNEGPVKTSIIDFVTRVTKQGGADFVPTAQRIATFDNDSTLWGEAAGLFSGGFRV
jgi:hypothetical protein